MKNIYLLIIISIFLLSSCNMDQTEWKTGESLTVTEYPYFDEYKMILIPVPEEGIAFPVSIEDFDDSMSYIENAYYLGETEITIGLWYIVAEWATYKKEGDRYTNITFNKHRYFPLEEMEYPVNDITYIQALI